MAAKGRNRADIGTSVSFFPVTPDDNVDLPVETAALCIAVGGNIVVDRLDGTTVTLTVPAGTITIAVQRVRATGTTATGITALV